VYHYRQTITASELAILNREMIKNHGDPPEDAKPSWTTSAINGQVIENNPLLSIHSNNSNLQTQMVQSQLNDFLNVSKPLTVDGKFGGRTERAVREAQKELGIPQNGIFNTQTLYQIEMATMTQNTSIGSQTGVMQNERNNIAGNAGLDFVIDNLPYLGTGKSVQQVLTGYNYVTETDLSTRDRVIEGIGGAASFIPIPGAKQVGKQVGGKIVDGAVWVWQRMGDGVSFIRSKLPGKGNPATNNTPPVRGLSPNDTRPPGFNEDWKSGPASRPSEANKGGQSYYDPNGGEWRYYPEDKYHQAHWDYNSHSTNNSPWENIPFSQGGATHK
jgi:peptidoglycan hydrolase-like protein with peptidoglycan-binding domain